MLSVMRKSTYIIGMNKLPLKTRAQILTLLCAMMDAVAPKPSRRGTYKKTPDQISD